jgi:hypothetical protein
MTHRQAGLLVFHGALLLLVGNLTGIPFAGAIQDGWGPDAVRAWRVAHTSLVMGGLLYVAMGAARAHISLSPGAAAALVGTLIATAYVFTFALILGASIGARGLSGEGPVLHGLVFGLFAFSVLALFGASGLFLWGAWRALARPAP